MLVNILLLFVYVSSIVLILLVASQTTKSEGFAGMIGGGLQSNIKYLPGQEEILQQYTTWTAAIWMLSCLLWFFLTNHH